MDISVLPFGELNELNGSIGALPGGIWLGGVWGWGKGGGDLPLGENSPGLRLFVFLSDCLLDGGGEIRTWKQP